TASKPSSRSRYSMYRPENPAPTTTTSTSAGADPFTDTTIRCPPAAHQRTTRVYPAFTIDPFATSRLVLRESQQVTGEPVQGQPGDLLQRARLLEQVRGARNDLQPGLATQLLHGGAVELDDCRVELPDDEQGRLADRAQAAAGEVGAAAAGDDRGHRAGPGRGRDQRRRGAGARAEQPDREAWGGVVTGQPVGQGGDPQPEHADVEPELTGPLVDLLLRRGEQVGQDGGQAGALELAGHVSVARAVAAAAAALREQHHSARRLGGHQVGGQRHAARPTAQT